MVEGMDDATQSHTPIQIWAAEVVGRQLKAEEIVSRFLTETVVRHPALERIWNEGAK